MWAYRVEWVAYRGPLHGVRAMRYYARDWEAARLRLEVVQGRVGASNGTIMGTWSWLLSWVHEVGG